MKNQFFWLWTMALGLALSACGGQSTETETTQGNKQTTTVVATMQASTNHLFYSGTLQPLAVSNLISPAEGIVRKLYFQYGSQVQAGQLLVEIASSKSQQDYVTALTNYIKDKDQYLTSKNSFVGTAALYKAGIVDREDYLSQKSQLETNQLAYLSSTSTLKALVEKIPNAPKDIETLSLSDINHIEEMLTKEFNDYKLQAPITGIALIPEKSAGGGSDASDKTLSMGTEVKEGQILLSIGDMSGVAATINVSENDINQLALQQPVLITSPALPGLLFHGYVSNIGRQAKSDNPSSPIATFPVKITVPTISDLERNLVRVGMTAKIDIAIQNPSEIKIPINAVFMVNGVPTVTVIDHKTGKKHDVSVETGATDLTQISILKGLKPGDKVLVRD